MEDEIRTFIAVLLLSGYCKVPYQDLYWVDAPDTHNESVLCTMSRNTFREILSNLHLADNTQTAEDRYYKVRVLFEKLNFNLKQYDSFVNEPLMKALSHTMENTAQNNLLEESPLGCPLEYWSGPGCRCSGGFD